MRTIKLILLITVLATTIFVLYKAATDHNAPPAATLTVELPAPSR